MATKKTTTSKTTTAAPKKAAAPAAPKAAAAAKPGAKAAGNGVPPKAVVTVTHDQIAKKAFEIWVAKGRPTGLDAENWKEAEAALRAGR